MEQLTISIDRSYKPGGELTGHCEWFFEKEVQEIELHLLWHTEGKGDEDVEVVERKTLSNISNTGREQFSFKLPDSPYSFSGQLISLVWGIEAVVKPGKTSELVEFVLSPTGEEIRLEAEAK